MELAKNWFKCSLAYNLPISRCLFGFTMPGCSLRPSLLGAIHRSRLELVIHSSAKPQRLKWTCLVQLVCFLVLKIHNWTRPKMPSPVSQPVYTLRVVWIWAQESFYLFLCFLYILQSKCVVSSMLQSYLLVLVGSQEENLILHYLSIKYDTWFKCWF